MNKEQHYFSKGHPDPNGYLIVGVNTNQFTPTHERLRGIGYAVSTLKPEEAERHLIMYKIGIVQLADLGKNAARLYQDMKNAKRKANFVVTSDDPDMVELAKDKDLKLIRPANLSEIIKYAGDLIPK